MSQVRRRLDPGPRGVGPGYYLPPMLQDADRAAALPAGGSDSPISREAPGGAGRRSPRGVLTEQPVCRAQTGEPALSLLLERGASITGEESTNGHSTKD